MKAGSNRLIEKQEHLSDLTLLLESRQNFWCPNYEIISFDHVCGCRIAGIEFDQYISELIFGTFRIGATFSD
jgi:hypothetical protein